LAVSRRLTRWALPLQVMVLGISLPYLANSTGWLLAELGRQPWIVQGLMKTADGVSPTVPMGMVAFSLVGFTLLYAALMVADVYLMAKFARGRSVHHEEGEPALAY
jgi:cytochrome d ubiquinol oxidase subunit I